MLPFYCSITCSVVCRSEIDGDTEGFEDVLEEVGAEGVAVVRDGDGRQAVPGHPVHEGLGYLLGRVPDQGIDLYPPKATIQTGKKIFVPVTDWQWTHYVHMDVLKTLVN